jgi:serine/threonine protein kinase
VQPSVFQQCALASSLLTQVEIDEALAALGKPNRRSSKPITDEMLANKLVDMGRLNRWQADQLRKGRTKFTLSLYQVIDSIGQGGMGHVYKAEHSVMGRVVAIKVLPRDRCTPDAIVNFSREIRAQAQLDHENLVRAYDAGHDGNVYFLVTEYVPGTDLRKLIRSQGKLNMNLAASVITQAARGLEHAHSRGLIHRDVKPGNLLVMPDGRTKVSDLGLAGYFGQSEQTDNYGGKVVGTADYLAPEQITTPDSLTPASDIYALGCTLYYAVTGKVPFPGGSPRDKARKHCHDAPLDPRRLNAELSDDFVEVIADMMAKRPDERLQNAAAVIARLAPWVGSPLPATAEVVPLPPAPPPINIPPVIQLPHSPVADTEPYFLVQPKEEPEQGESPSQQSLGTSPVASASDATQSSFGSQDSWGGNLAAKSAAPIVEKPATFWEKLPPAVRQWLPILIAAIAGGLVTVLVSRLFK